MSRPSTAESERLVAEALERIQTDDPEAAIWRLIDAAGLIRRNCFVNPMGIGLTEKSPTGRGFYLGMTSMRAIDPFCDN